MRELVGVMLGGALGAAARLLGEQGTALAYLVLTTILSLASVGAGIALARGAAG